MCCASHFISGLGVYTYAIIPQKGDLLAPFPRYDSCRRSTAEWRINMKRKMQLFDYINYTILFLIGICMLYPFVNIIAVSFSSYEAFIENPLRIIPKEFNFNAYKDILRHAGFYKSYLNTIIVTLVGTVASLFLYSITAYPLARKDLRGRRGIMVYVLFTMLFNGGLIPNFYVVKELGLYDTLLILVIKGMFSAYNLILVKSFFENISESLLEAARVDGANEPTILFKIVMPVSKPILATIGLFTAVGYWNNYYNAVVYIKSASKWPLMLFLREIIMGAKMSEMATGGNLAEAKNVMVDQVMLQYSTLLLVILPILCVYPFLQRYFVKGMMLGSVKE